jgi:hypothetical protein
MRQLARQINEVLARADTEALAGELSAATYARLAGVLVRIAEAGLKCDKHRKDQQRKQDGEPVGDTNMKSLQTELTLF